MDKLLEFLNQHHAVKALALSLLHSLWQGAAIACLLWLLIKTVRNLSAGIRYRLALAALSSLVAGFVLTLYLELNTQPMANRMAGEVSILLHSSSEGTTLSTTEKTVFQEMEMKWFGLMDWVHQHVAYFFLAWAVGSLIFSLRFFTGLHYLRKLRGESSPLPESWAVTIETLKQKLGLHKKVSLMASDKVSSPLTFGWLRPVVVFPLSMLTLLPHDQVESILLHELAHIRRHDYLVNLLQSIVEIAFFFNPAHWYISQVLERERELVCDDMVLAQTVDPHLYARALTNLAELSIFKNSRLAMNIARQESSLFFRVKRIINPSKSDIMENPIKRKSYQLASMILACTIVFFLTLDGNGSSANAKDMNFAAENIQEKNISGVVLNKHGGAAIPGVSVKVKNSNVGTVTDREGNFTLTVKSDDILKFAFIGFQDKEVAVTGNSYYAVILESIEKVENSRVVINEIKVEEHSEQQKTQQIVFTEQLEEEVSRVFIIPEGSSVKPFMNYISKAEQTEPQHQDAKEISPAELASMDEASILSKMIISSEVTGSKRSVTIIKLKKPEDQAVVVSEQEQEVNSQPIFVILTEDILSSAKPGPEELKAAFKKGTHMRDAKNVDPHEISSIFVLKEPEALASFGEEAKHGVIFITLKKPEEEQMDEPVSKNEEDFVVYPNPGSSLVKVKFYNPKKQQVVLEALAPDGSKIYTFVNEVLGKGFHEYEWNAAVEGAGIYNVRLKQNSEVKTRKLILK